MRWPLWSRRIRSLAVWLATFNAPITAMLVRSEDLSTLLFNGGPVRVVSVPLTDDMGLFVTEDSDADALQNLEREEGLRVRDREELPRPRDRSIDNRREGSDPEADREIGSKSESDEEEFGTENEAASSDDSSDNGVDMRVSELPPPATGDLIDESLPAYLTLADVLASTYQAFPQILEARERFAIAEGDYLSAFGSYDTKAKAYSRNQPMGFYENFRQGLGLERQFWWGTEITADYKIGRGSFEPWYRERQTEEGGQFKIGVRSPLLQGLCIDQERVDVLQANLQRRGASPSVRATVLDVSRDAAQAYWDWVGAGANLRAQNQLTELALKRSEQIKTLITAGKLPEVNRVLNRQFVAERRQKELSALLKLRVSAVKLSLYLRDAAGRPVVPGPRLLPASFPDVPTIDAEMTEPLVDQALVQRPEMETLRIDAQTVGWDIGLARNQLLPELDLLTEVSEDMGPPGTSSNDKGEFKLFVGIESQVPLQRRKARGKLRSLSAKQRQILQKLRLTRDKIATDVRQQIATLETTEMIARQASIAFQAALASLESYRIGFREGSVDLLFLNALELSTTEDQLAVIDARAEFFASLAKLQVAMGIDPMEPSILLSMQQEPGALLDPAETSAELIDPGPRAELVPPGDREIDRE